MKKYCVYLTIYSGDKLPPLYIGSSSVKRVENGYKGSVSSKEHKHIWKEQLLLSPALFETKILKRFNTREEASLYENFLHHSLDVVNDENYINKWYAVPNGFKGYSSKGINNPNYGKKHSEETRKKISEKAKGRKISCEQRKNLSVAAQKRKKENSWNQLKDKELFKRFDSYEVFGKEIMYFYESCDKIPLFISEKMNVTEGSVKTYLKHHDKEYISNANWSKILRNYGNRWSNITEYENNIISLHNNGLSPGQISKELKINGWGVLSVLKKHMITPHKAKTGPKTNLHS